MTGKKNHIQALENTSPLPLVLRGATLSLNPFERSLVSLPLQQSGTGRSPWEPPGSQSCSGSGGSEVPGPSWALLDPAGLGVFGEGLRGCSLPLQGSALCLTLGSPGER